MKDIIQASDIPSRIYRIRGQQVMLDADLARLYGVSTGRLNEQVRRNIKRFPLDFMFRLSVQETEASRSQSAILKRGENIKYRPYAFTEQGIAMLSGVLRSDRAIQVNIAIMRTFIQMRHAMLAHQAIARRVEKLEGKVDVHETDIRLLWQDVDRLKKHPRPSGPIDPSIL